MPTIDATQLKAKCLAILDQVAKAGETVVILRRGKPVDRLVPPVATSARYRQDELKGTVVIHGNVLEPSVPAEAWEAEQGVNGDLSP